MTNEHGSGDGNGRGSGGSGGERDPDAVDLDASPDEPTVVISPDDYVLGVLGRLSERLRDLADRNDEFAAVVREAGAAAALGEIREDARDLELIAGGIVRGLDRLIRATKKETP